MNHRNSLIEWLKLLAAALVGVVSSLLIRSFVSHQRTIRKGIAQSFSVSDPQFERVMGHLLGPPLVDGNRVETLVNGAEILPAMLEAIRTARATITFETFIYWSGEVAQEFSRALAEQARAGVKVHILLDGVGCNCVDSDLLREMREAGAEVEIYHLVRWYNLDRLNNRTHRKLLVVDGRLGFTGGVGIADQWSGHAEDPDHWRDTHYRVEGPVVAQMQSAFMDNWMKMRAQILQTEDYFPQLEPVGTQRCQMIRTGPEAGTESARTMFMLSLAGARESIHIASSYFVPDDLVLDQLIKARERGVTVDIVIPGPHIDRWIVQPASRMRWGELLRHGVRLHEFQPTMYHCKMMTVDGLWTSVGSANFDHRSFRLNSEANLNVLDRDFASEQIRIFQADIARSRPVEYRSWQERPLTARAAEAAAEVVRTQL